MQQGLTHVGEVNLLGPVADIIPRERARPPSPSWCVIGLTRRDKVLDTLPHKIRRTGTGFLRRRLSPGTVDDAEELAPSRSTPRAYASASQGLCRVFTDESPQGSERACESALESGLVGLPPFSFMAVEADASQAPQTVGVTWAPHGTRSQEDLMGREMRYAPRLVGVSHLWECIAHGT